MTAGVLEHMMMFLIDANKKLKFVFRFKRNMLIKIGHFVEEGIFQRESSLSLYIKWSIGCTRRKLEKSNL